MGMKAGVETGSLINHLMSRSGGVVPEVGMGVSILFWSDREAGTIVKISPSGKQIHVQRDKAVRVDGNGMSDQQSYEFSPDPSGRIEIFRLGKRGFRSSDGAGLMIGERSKYYDYSF